MPKVVDFCPDWTSAPGETIQDALEERNLSSEEFANLMGTGMDDVTTILNGESAITPEIARKLASVIGASANFWMQRQVNHQARLAELTRAKGEREGLDWLKELPVKDIVKFGWVEDAPTLTATISRCLQFFRVVDVASWRRKFSGLQELAAFRKSKAFTSKLGPTVAWLQQGENLADRINCENWNPIRFQECLTEIRPLSRTKGPSDFLSKLQELCSKCGVAVAIVPSPSGCRASGATKFLHPNKALLLLSLRHLTDDHFWFTFFHESGHLLLHSKTQTFLDFDEELSSEQERQANEFAETILIPEQHLDEFLRLKPEMKTVIKFAQKLEISPGIVVGQLQNANRINRRTLNGLKRKYRWVP